MGEVGAESLLEESIPWEVRLLKDYLKSTADLDSVSYPGPVVNHSLRKWLFDNFFFQLGYAKRSVLAGVWFLCSQTTPPLPGVCLRGEGRWEEALVRQWVEFYLTRVKLETAWDTLSRDKLQQVLEVSNRISIMGSWVCSTHTED